MLIRNDGVLTKIDMTQFAKEYMNMAADFKIYRRNNKRRVLPNSRELVVNWNSRNAPETISEHNDPQRVDWTEIE